MSAPMPPKTVFSRFCPKRENLRFAALVLGLGCVSTLALPPLHILPVLLLTFGLFGQVLNAIPNWRRAAWAGAGFGFGFYAAGLYWLVNAVLIRSDAFWWFVPFPSLGCALILAPTVAAPAALCTLFPAGIRRLSAFAALWTVFDMGRTFIFSGFTWNALGSSLASPGPDGGRRADPCPCHVLPRLWRNLAGANSSGPLDLPACCGLRHKNCPPAGIAQARTGRLRGRACYMGDCKWFTALHRSPNGRTRPYCRDCTRERARNRKNWSAESARHFYALPEAHRTGSAGRAGAAGCPAQAGRAFSSHCFSLARNLFSRIRPDTRQPPCPAGHDGMGRRRRCGHCWRAAHG